MSPSAVLILLLLGIALLSFFWTQKYLRIIILHDYEKGLRYKNGRLVDVIGEGRYFSWRLISSIERVDMRKTSLFVSAQEVFTKDKIFVKITLSGHYRIIDAVRARHLSPHSDTELYARIQVALRDEVALLTLDELLDNRTDVGVRIEKLIQASTEALGLAVESLVIKDIMVPASIRKAYAGILEAQKEARKKLEQARGEQAVLRNLANSSAMYDKNPMLLQARLIQALASGTNSIVFNADGSLAIRTQNTSKAS